MDDGRTYDVRVYRTEVYKGAKVTTYWVRWKVGDKTWKEPFRNAAQADSFRSSLLAAARNGEAFSLTTGRPVTWKRPVSSMSWYALTLAYTAAKWDYVSPNHRRGIAEALIDATEAMLAVDETPYGRDEVRRALRSWAFSARLQGQTEPPADLAAVVRWLESATIPLEELERPGSGTLRIRLLLDRISKKKDGTTAAANTANRKRMVLGSVMDYAYETGVLATNPVKRVKWAKPRVLKTVDPRIVINVDQAQRLLAAIGAQGSRGERLVAFFACMYYAALRPEEVIDLRRSHLVSLPAHGWGEMRLTHSEPRSGARWTDNGRSRERRELKHRAAGDTRSVPIHPDLAQLLRAHLDTFGTGRDGRVFVGPRGGIAAEWVYLDVYHRARRVAFTGIEAQSQLAGTPYALRHAAVSTWLNAGVGAPQVAEWAGHSVEVLLRVYAKCIAGQQDEAKRRILQATSLSATDTGL
jgi:integrase